jgi:uncharacterized membrane protein
MTLEQPRNDGTSRWLQLLLVLSLSLNLLIAGAVFGGAWVVRHHPDGAMPGRGPAMAMMGPLGKFVTTLKAERRAELREFIAKHQAGSGEFNKTMSSVRREVADVLLAAPFDPAKFEAALKRLYDAEAAARATNIAANSAFVEHLTDAERAAFLKSLNWPGVPGADKTLEEVPVPPKAP